MTSYKEPFGKAWNKLLKNDFFPNVLNNAQPIIIQVSVGRGWDWLSVVPVEGTIIELEITEEEIKQCNYNENGFICYVNFGKGYKFLVIPYESIFAVYIGNRSNWINNPILATKFNLIEEQITYLTSLKIDEKDEDDTVENID